MRITKARHLLDLLEAIKKDHSNARRTSNEQVVENLETTFVEALLWDNYNWNTLTEALEFLDKEQQDANRSI